jgi:anti-sigma factor RsiW
MCYAPSVVGHEGCGCREVAFELLLDYYEGDLPEHLARRVETHLQECSQCQRLVHTYRMTAELSRETLRTEMPIECEVALSDFLEQHVPGCLKKTP